MKEKVKIGYIGLGRRGIYMLENAILLMKDVEIKTVCDMDPEKLERATALFEKMGRPKPATTTDYFDILNDKEIDAVMVMTGWYTHVKCAIDSLKAGKYTAIEVGCAYDISECYQLVDAYEETHAPLMMLENCCYGRRELMALRMAREGLLGEVVYCAGGYHHYLNDVELFVKQEDGTYDTNHYRLNEYALRNGEQYPTHEFGPLAKILNINRGNRMLTLSSFASKSRGLKAFIKENVSESHPFYNTEFRQGDIISTNITCAGGELVHLTLDTTIPRPYYTREFTVRGTKGACLEHAANGTVFVEGMEEGVFNNEEEAFKKYDHPLFREFIQQDVPGGHGGLDWLVSRAFFESVKRGVQTPIDAYDTAAWMAIAPLSEMSIALGGAPVSVPDFTRGKWMRREPAVEGKYGLQTIVSDPETPIIP